MIANDTEFQEKLDQLGRLYKAVRVQFAGLTVSQDNAPALILGTGKIVDALTEIISDIEEYSGAAEVRRLTAALKDIRQQRNQSNG